MNLDEHVAQIGKMLLGESDLGSFRSQVKDVQLYGDTSPDDVDIDYDLTAMVAWTLDMDARDWGVKDIGLHIQEVKIEGIKTTIGMPDPNNVYDDDTEKEEDFSLHWSPEVEGWNVKVDDYGRERSFPFDVYPTEVEVNLVGRVIEVRF